MGALVLGGVGTMGVHASAELIASQQFNRILIADADADRVKRLVAEWGLPPDAAVTFDAADQQTLQQLVGSGQDVVVNALPKQFALDVARAATTARARVIDLNSLSPAMHALDRPVRDAGSIYVAGCGSSSGLTNMMASQGARGMDQVDEIEINMASFRAIALSPASIHGVLWEFGPDSVRGYFADGAYHQVALWQGEKTVDFPPPFGRQTVYILPHSEPHTLSRNLGARRVVARGTFTPKVMRLVRSLHEYGFFGPDPVMIHDQPIARRALIEQYLAQVPEASQEPVWGYALLVQVIGSIGTQRLQRTLWTTHPGPEEPGWSGPAAWAKCVALPLVAGSLLLARGDYTGGGLDSPEAFLPPAPFLAELSSRGLQVHETEEQLGWSSSPLGTSAGDPQPRHP